MRHVMMDDHTAFAGISFQFVCFSYEIINNKKTKLKVIWKSRKKQSAQTEI